MTDNRHSLPSRHPKGLTPLGSQAVRLPPMTARSRNLVRFARQLPVETMDESFAGALFQGETENIGNRSASDG